MILAWADFIKFLSTPPVSMWFIYFVSILVSLSSTLLNKLLVDHDKLARQQEVINEHKTKKKNYENYQKKIQKNMLRNTQSGQEGIQALKIWNKR